MTPPGGRSAIPFLLQPWRYDAEGSRDWAAARFAIFTVTSPEPTMRRLGGKARGGRLPRGPLGRLPARLWMQLTERGLLVAGDGWDVAVTSTSRRAAAPGQAWVARCAHAVDARQPERHLRRAQTWVADLQVDDSLVTFRGSRIDGHWAGEGMVDGFAVVVAGQGLEPSDVQLGRLVDPAAHLAGERDYFR